MKKVIGVGAAALVTAIGVAILGTQPDTIFQNGFDPTSAPLCGQQQLGDVYFTLGSHAQMDITRFENLLGKASVQSAAVLFPGVDVSPYINSVGKQAFVSARFTVPMDIPVTKTGKISLGETYAGNPIDISITQSCGFGYAATNCLVQRLTSGQGISWKIYGGSPSLVACTLYPGAPYFLNIKFNPVPPSGTGYNCSANGCKLPLLNQVSR